MQHNRWLSSRIVYTRYLVIAILIVSVISKSIYPSNTFLHSIIEWAGYFLIIAGVNIRVFCSVYIGGKKNDSVMSEGPFSVVRNPLYFGSLIATIGVSLQTTSILLTVIIIALFVFYYTGTIRKEETFLENKFGNIYSTYKKSVPRWIPDLTLWKSTEAITVKPRFVGRAMVDSVAFMAFVPFFQILHNAQSIFPKAHLLNIF